jgi:hypothetical protein
MEWIVKDTTPSTAVTGTTTRTQIGSSVLIPANTFNAEDVMILSFGIQKPTVNGTMNYRFLHNTENTLSGATSIANAFLAIASLVTSSLERTFEISGGLLKCRFSGTTVSFTDKQASASAGLSIAFNPTIDNEHCARSARRHSTIERSTFYRNTSFCSLTNGILFGVNGTNTMFGNSIFFI